MSSEKIKKEVYSLHRYILEDGSPDFDKVFSVKESELRRHVDPWLLGHLDNQPDIIREYKRLNEHLRGCDGCRKKIGDSYKEPGQFELK